MSENFLGSARNGEEISLGAGEILFSKGDTGHEIYVVRSGELQILDGNRVFETVGPGGIVGEMALVDGGPRSATVRAGMATEVVPLDERHDTSDLARALALPVVLVVGLRLGCLNHALLTARAIQASGLSLAGWVANQIDPHMESQAENIRALQARLDCSLLGVLPYRERMAAKEFASLLDITQLPQPGKR